MRITTAEGETPKSTPTGGRHGIVHTYDTPTDGVVGPEAAMSGCFADVLALEEDRLRRVHGARTLAMWRDELIRDVMDRRSPHALALQPAADPHARSGFLEQWAGLLARMIRRLDADLDATRTAALILAAVHGGVILSRLDVSSDALEAALDLALDPLTARGASVAWHGDDDRAAASGQAPDRAGREDAREDRRDRHGPDAPTGSRRDHAG